MQVPAFASHGLYQSGCTLCSSGAGPSQGSVDQERSTMAAGLRLQDDLMEVVLSPKDGCDACRTPLAILSAPFSAPGESIIRADGMQLHPSQRHFARHVLWDTFELP